MAIPSLHVLAELRPLLPGADHRTSPVARAFLQLGAALAIHDAALTDLDRAEAAFMAAQTGVGAVEAEGDIESYRGDGGDPSGPERLGHRPGKVSSRRRRRQGVGSKRRAFVVRRAREGRLARRAGVLTDHLLSAPATGWGDIALKLAVIVAAEQGGPPDAEASPWVGLRRLLAEMAAVSGP